MKKLILIILINSNLVFSTARKTSSTKDFGYGKYLIEHDAIQKYLMQHGNEKFINNFDFASVTTSYVGKFSFEDWIKNHDIINKNLAKSRFKNFEKLINENSNLNFQMKYDHELFMKACFWGNKETVEFFIKAGADINGFSDHWTPLMRASFEGHAEVVKLLIQSGANINAKSTDEGMTALMLTTNDRKIKAAEVLLNYNAEVNERDKKGWTALIHASNKQSLTIVSMLLQSNADVSIKNKDGSFALDYAADAEIIELLKQKNAPSRDIDSE